METWQIILIVIACAVIFALVVLALLFFTGAITSLRERAKADRAGATARQLKKTHTYAVNNASDLIAENADKMKGICELYSADVDDELRGKLMALHEKLRYLSPAPDTEADDIDARIGDRLDDLRHALNLLHLGKGDAARVQSEIFEVESLLSSRRA